MNTIKLTEYIFMPQHNSLVDLRLSKPGNFLRGEEDLNSNVLITPFPLPHFTVSAFPNTSDQCYLLRYCPLNLATDNGHHIIDYYIRQHSA